MLTNILTKEQQDLLPLISSFSSQFYLVGGTALALQLGHRRAKWKDYVDLYFVFKKYSLIEVVSWAKKLFVNQINERLLREQLDYFADVDYSEAVEYLPGMAVADKVVKARLQKIAVS